MTAGAVARVRVRNAQTARVLADTVDVARTRLARARGLLGRSALGAGEALWIAPSRGVHTFGMRFVIDVIALDAGGTVVDVAGALKPWRIRLPRRGTAGVLELPSGSAAASGTQVGHQIQFEVVSDVDSRAVDRP